MALNLTQKQVVVSGLNELAQKSISAVAVDNKGLTVADMTGLRKLTREANVTMRVYRNTLAKLALKDTSFSCLDEVLVGPTVLFFSQDEPGSAARILRDFLKSNKDLEVKALVMEGDLLPASQLEAVASLPSRDEALAKLMSQMMAPVTQLVRTINEPVAQVTRAVAAVRDQKQ